MIEETILAHLVYDAEYSRKVIPHIIPEYFEKPSHQIACKLILNHFKKYNKNPTKEVLRTELESKSLPDKIYEETSSFLKSMTFEQQDQDWIFDKTEEYVKERALFNALTEAVEASETDKKGEIPDILQKALSISFDTAIGHDYFADAKARYEFYHRKESRIPFDIELLNKITQGGTYKKTFNMLMAGTGVGKSLVMCHMAAANIAMGMNVLYITMEMSEEWISKRIDANLFNIDINDIDDLSEDEYLGRIDKLRKKTHGNLKVKEFPTSGAHVGHFRYLLSELKQKQGFVPDVIYIDYLNICSSFKKGPGAGMYEYNKSIAEEIRGLAVEGNYCIWSATQVNREGLKMSDFDMTETSESMGIVHTLDLFLALITTDELEKMHQIKFKQMKNRYGPKDFYKSFAVGIKRSSMRLYDIDDQDTITKDAEPEEDTPRTKSMKDKFEEAFGG